MVQLVEWKPNTIQPDPYKLGWVNVYKYYVLVCWFFNPKSLSWVGKYFKPNLIQPRHSWVYILLVSSSTKSLTCLGNFNFCKRYPFFITKSSRPIMLQCSECTIGGPVEFSHSLLKKVTAYEGYQFSSKVLSKASPLTHV